MSSLIRELFHGSSYRHRPNYYYDDGVVSYGAAGRGVHPDVVLHVPMDSMKTVERVKHALAMNGVYRVNVNMMNQTVIVSGNVPAETLLRRVRWVKRHSQIISVGSPYSASSAYGSGYPINNPYALDVYPASPPFNTPYDNYSEYDNSALVDYGTSYGSSYGGLGSGLGRQYSSAFSYY